METSTLKAAATMYDALVEKHAKGGAFDEAMVREVCAELRDGLVEMIAGALEQIAAKRKAKASLADTKAGQTQPAEASREAGELRKVKERTEANLAAMRRLKQGPPYNDDDQKVLAGYSGWGGLSLEAVKEWPEPDFSPEARGLIHEYYTPQRVTDEVVRAILPMIPSLPKDEDGVLRVLEPSVGIGRFVDSLNHFGVRANIEACEYSEVSAALFAARFPKVKLNVGPFERFVARDAAPRFGLVLANPPYGERGPSRSEDRLDYYRAKDDGTWKNAYAYFMRRASDLLVSGGVGVWLIPAGFMHGTGDMARKLRERILLRNHILAAFRLPSGLFPGAEVVVDLVLLQARNGVLQSTLPSDQGILDGKYFEQHPQHILGEEIGKQGEDENQTKKPRWGYQIKGVFDKLPDFEPRPMIEGVLNEDAFVDTKRQRVSVKRVISLDIEGLTPELAQAAALGLRVDEVLASKHQSGVTEVALDVEDWIAAHGNPHKNKDFKDAASSNDNLARFLSVISKEGEVSASLKDPEIRLTEDDSDILAFALAIYRNSKDRLNIKSLQNTLRARGKHQEVTQKLVEGGWCINPALGLAWPADDFYTGDLWSKLDSLAEQIPTLSDPERGVVEAQVTRLRALIGAEDISTIECSPKDRWVPDDVILPYLLSMLEGQRIIAGGIVRLAKNGVEAFKDFKNIDLTQPAEEIRLRYPTLGQGDDASLTHPGVLSVKTVDGRINVFVHGVKLALYGRKYDELGFLDQSNLFIGKVNKKLKNIIGWMNSDRDMFEPTKEDRERDDETTDDMRKRLSKIYQDRWLIFLDVNYEYSKLVEQTYNRLFKGYINPPISSEAPPVLRWRSDKIRLHDYQQRSVNRLVQKRGGLLALDVGLGKTYTGIYTMALARQQGWARRPVIVVPNSLALKWKKDILRVLPDYRVGVIGVTEGQFKRGDKAGMAKSEPDGADERGRKWTEFQLGAYDVVIVTQSVFGCTRINETSIEAYSEAMSSVKHAAKEAQRIAAEKHDRLIEIERGQAASPFSAEGKAFAKKYKDAKAIARAKEDNKLTEREKVILVEGAKGLVAEWLEAPENMGYDTGPAWDDIGVDFIMVDEAQRYKNLWKAMPREGGTPMYMGAAGEGSGLAYYLDYRAWSVRRKTGGAGVLLLSATPAKNSPLEIYNLIQYVNPKVFTSRGVDSPVAFEERYIKFDTKSVVDAQGEVKDRSFAKSFGNLHELRDILNDQCEFKTAEEVGLAIPEAESEVIYLQFSNMTDGTYLSQALAYEGLRQKFEEEIDKAKQGGNKGKQKGVIVSLMARMSMVCVHPLVDTVDSRAMVKIKDKYGEDKEVRAKGDPKGDFERALVRKTGYESPKFTAALKNIIANKHCAHIIFLESVVGHALMWRNLEAAGFNTKRVAFLNALKAKSISDRQAIAEHFNGSDDTPPKYDVVICNSVAYEGVDLQRRTCMIHHIDLPYEFATLQQRNGRGVRQGNKYLDDKGRSVVKIFYYCMEGSLDIYRQQMIKGKRGWMITLVQGQDRSTNNPSNEGEDDDMLVAMMSKDPEEAKKKIAAVRAKQLRLAKVNVVQAVCRRFNLISTTYDRMLDDGGSFSQERGTQSFERYKIMLAERFALIQQTVNAIDADKSGDLDLPDDLIQDALSGVPTFAVLTTYKTDDDDKESTERSGIAVAKIQQYREAKIGTGQTLEIGLAGSYQCYVQIGSYRWVAIPYNSSSFESMKDAVLLPKGSTEHRDSFFGNNFVGGKMRPYENNPFIYGGIDPVVGQFFAAPADWVDRVWVGYLASLRPGQPTAKTLPFITSDGLLGACSEPGLYGSSGKTILPIDARVLKPTKADFTLFIDKLRSELVVPGTRRELLAKISRDWFGRILRASMGDEGYQEPTPKDLMQLAGFAGFTRRRA